MDARKNGLMYRWSLKQCLSYFGYIVYGIFYNLIVVKKTHEDYQILNVIVFNFLFCLSVTSHLVTSLINPGDPLLYIKNNNRQADSIYLHCTICNKEINLFSRHCVTCNKCIYKYDHHCYWVNNCIGSRNYKPFFVLIISSTLMCAILVSSSFTAMFLIFSTKTSFDANDEQGLTSFIIFLGLNSLISFFYFGYITTFHLVMVFKDISTYEYICKKRAKSNSHVVPRLVVDKEFISVHTENTGISFGISFGI
ncbi:hypothetical protein SteCoe_1205 [Stentor coeruleus]|uniref:Palmitoyltransferase n=1 Tax=Stentor coeruleus TaxID=5963 RepID=A0A1R2D2G2_9CILI|nr:hypothetical protein SteCoe_1205 [Stentor coeruleus]